MVLVVLVAGQVLALVLEMLPQQTQAAVVQEAQAVPQAVLVVQVL
jgi:hypothetical protein